MFIASYNKNPMINLERKCLNQQKPQFSLGSKFSQYAWQICMKHENKWKKKGYKGLISLRGQKPLKKFEGKWQKSCFES